MSGGNPGEKTHHEDGALVRRAKEEREAFDALYVKYLKKVYTYVFYRIGNVEDAEDITESVFLHALIHLDRYQDRGIPFSAWLLRIAHNLVANWHRNSKRRRVVDLDAAEPLQDTSPTPEEALESEEERRQILALLETLPEERQQALILRYAEGMKHKEIGEVMGKSAGAVKVLIHRSLISLHRGFSEKEDRR
ncbi:MAG: sigma-70 family RNA polymerase sigma factor [Actinomycetota bacterium]|nr:sigma-70 family RNA polymerase sigma factor [Actinomycetota bacterium]MDD5666494.1 sigma-70 family RNA polymerase sigma factor [Actinomycetota bacterium]